jgi:hypothetical protein
MNVTKKWCATCQTHTVCDLDRCSVCGMSRALPVGEQCTCGTISKNGQWLRILNPRCVVHGRRSHLRPVK